MPDRKRKSIPDYRSNVLKGSLPNGPNHPRNTISEAEQRVRRNSDFSCMLMRSKDEEDKTFLVG